MIYDRCSLPCSIWDGQAIKNHRPDPIARDPIARDPIARIARRAARKSENELSYHVSTGV